VFPATEAGEEGVRQVIRNFVADFDLTLGLAGWTSAGAITPEALDSGNSSSHGR
jgi:isopentenyl diphosphate isomerase/L-lactate dehydrogenase-like FMN-dependent dehydrogenase